tara:strand:- start:129 stop:1220 length:1092 start_codon:yes stop_codon:yes gene_type:complete
MEIIVGAVAFVCWLSTIAIGIKKKRPVVGFLLALVCGPFGLIGVAFLKPKVSGINLKTPNEEIDLNDEREALKHVAAKGKSASVRAYAASKLSVPSKAKSLIDQAAPFYSGRPGSPEKAYALYMEALSLASNAPADPTHTEAIDLNDIGFAGWAAWVCLDRMNAEEKDFEALFALLRLKTPVTLQRIETRIMENNRQKAERENAAKLLAELLDPAKKPSPATANELIDLHKGKDAWWTLRDIGNKLAKIGRFDLAWKFFQSAVLLAFKCDGNVPSIYVAMGNLSKKEGRYENAARDFLLACKYEHEASQQFPKTASDQLRISLKKAGLKNNAAEHRDDLLSRIPETEISDLLDVLSRKIAEAS